MEQTVNGYISIDPKAYMPTVDEIKEQSRAETDRNYAYNYRYLLARYRGYNPGSIPWYMKPFVYVFGDAERNAQGNAWAGGSNPWHILMKRHDSVFSDEDFYTKFKRRFPQYIEKINIALDRHSVENVGGCFNPLTYKETPKYAYPEFIVAISNAARLGEKSILISHDDYNTLCDTQRRMK